MSLYRRWVLATVGAALAAYLVTLPIYRHAAALGLGTRFTPWHAAGSLIELAIYVLVTYWALSPVFPKLRAARYAAWTILPTLLVLVLMSMVDADVHGSVGSAPPAAEAAPDPLIGLLFTAPFLLLAAWGVLSLQWLSLSEAAEGYRPWVLWSLAGLAASFLVGVIVEALFGVSPFADLSTAGRQLGAYLYAVATSTAFGVASGFGVAQLRPKA
jgi:hypothetical protein